MECQGWRTLSHLAKLMPMKTREPITHMHNHACQNKQGNHTWKSILANNPTVDATLPCLILAFLFLLWPSFSFLNPMLKCSKKTPSVQECEREKIERELQNWIEKRYQLILISLFINEISIFLIFHYFPSISFSHATCDLSPYFSPNFLYFHKLMCQKCLFSF